MFIKPKDLAALKSCLAKRPLVLFGMGGMGQKIAEFCDINNISIACFVDNNTTRQDKTRQDKTRQDKTRQDKTRQDCPFAAKNARKLSKRKCCDLVNHIF